MGFLDLVKNFARPDAGGAARKTHAPQAREKSSLAGPMIAWSGVGQPRWTPRRYESFAEEGFRKNVIAYRCVMQIATASAAIPWLLYDDAGHEIDRHPLLGLLQHPNPLQDGVSFLESVYAQLQIAGNAYIEAVTPQNGAAPIELYVLRPDRMKIIPGPMGLPQGYQYSINGQVTSWPADPVTGASNILHLKNFHPLDDWYGMAPMEAALLSIDQHNAAGAWNQALLNQGARPAGALVYAPKDGPNTLTDTQMQRLREELGQLYQGSRNAGRPMVLEGGLDWREMSLSPKDMDWLSGRNNAARDIAQAFGVPAQLIGIPDSQTYSNMAEARMAFYEETVLPLITRVIAGVDHWLTPMFDGKLQLDFDPDQISALTPRRDAQWNKINNARFLTRNEQREAAGYGPVPGGDEPGDSDDPDPAALALEAANDARMEEAQVTWHGGKFNPYHDDRGRFTFAPDGPIESVSDNVPAVYKTPSGISYGNKIQKDMADRGWTPQQIDDAVKNGGRIDALNKATGGAATRYVNPDTGKSVVVDNATNSVIQVGGSGFGFGTGSGDVPGAVMRPAPPINPPADTPAGGGGGGIMKPNDLFHLDPLEREVE